MTPLDSRVLQNLLDWLRQGRRAWLCTIVATYGSSPRPVGSLFACNERGDVSGSLSGGCVEEDLVARLLRGDPALAGVGVLEYGVTAEENERLGLPCGGTLEVLLEPLAADSAAQIEQLLAAVRGRRYLRKTVDLATARVRLEGALDYADLRRGEGVVVQVFGPRHRMLLVGAGALSQTLARALADAAIVQPTLAGRPGNPVGFARALYPQLARLDGDRGARALLAAAPHAVLRVPVADPGILHDLDTLQALKPATEPQTKPQTKPQTRRLQ